MSEDKFDKEGQSGGQKVLSQDQNFSYELFPYERNQDVVVLNTQGPTFAASIVDGWSNTDFIQGDKAGRDVAELVANNFLIEFLHSDIANFQTRAKTVAKAVDQKVLEQYPSHASCVGGFVFDFGKQTIVVTEGSVFVYVWDGQGWIKPREVGEYALDTSQYPSDVSRFFGRGELKRYDPKLYRVTPDTAVLPVHTPIFIGTDGIEKLISAKDLNINAAEVGLKDANVFIESLKGLINTRRHLQSDDATIFVKF